MQLYDFMQQEFVERSAFPQEWISEKEFVVLCESNEIRAMQPFFNLDDDTILDCTDLDDSIRFSSFDGYDFISLIHMQLHAGEVLSHEINLYLGKNYLLIVFPEKQSDRVQALRGEIQKNLAEAGLAESKVCRSLYHVLDSIVGDYSDLLEDLEDHIVDMQEEIIVGKTRSEQFQEIDSWRKITYNIKKQLRATSYIGSQILLNSNLLLPKNTIKYFNSIETRLLKLYGFSENLYELSNQLLYSYDSKLAMKTNETVNKLTILTIFFAPLTVVTGIYGMNFSHMPELDWHLGYPAVLLLMLLISLGLYWFLKYKKWL